MSATVVFADKAPKPLPQFSQAVVYNGIIYISGNIGLDAVTWKLVDGGVKEQTRQALRNIASILEASQSDWREVLKVNIFLTEMSNFAAMNEAWDEVFTADYKPVSN
ncbi:hypothetical protein PFICI_11823 [Pestalotiopsis fici W106-1]|uniref:RutC family protein n=1 Tax=Pestalotiopsis fici (strain W106-1 / CGMCC3.15140) TaxID=1229662 RepID=W3WUA6_PESFW|nr:uncharacterized protein PFICI_11823 [Pestalotiopsis fici W106-1]ETS76436.1 hypothetical protein PFICI_11823 [Pestalotiopsis fici W106-1]